MSCLNRKSAQNRRSDDRQSNNQVQANFICMGCLIRRRVRGEAEFSEAELMLRTIQHRRNTTRQMYRHEYLKQEKTAQVVKLNPIATFTFSILIP